MPRVQSWRGEILEALNKEHWSLSGPKRPVKVVPLKSAPVQAAGGYFTTGQFLVGKTPDQIERALGLKLNDLSSGARIYRFIRLPLMYEYEHELTAKFPGGLVFNPAHSHPDYLPGHNGIQQWRIRDGMTVPVDIKNFLDLAPGQRFPYDWLT